MNQINVNNLIFKGNEFAISSFRVCKDKGYIKYHNFGWLGYILKTFSESILFSYLVFERGFKAKVGILFF